MSKTIPITINNILGGIAPSQYLTGEGQFSTSIAIDPEFPITDSAIRSSGVLRPVAYAKFSGAEVNNYVIATITNPKNALVYNILKNGKIISYDSSLGSETLVGTCTGSNAEGAAYYNDYIYISGTGVSKDDVSRYGPLSVSPSLTDGVWTGATLGSQTALTNTTYPAIRGTIGTYPNHWLHVHTDNKLYVCDFKTGVGYIHYIKTTAAGVNDGSTYNALDLPFGFMPTSICSYGNDLGITSIQTTNTTVNQGESMFYLWDTVDSSFYRPVPIPEPFAMATINNKGVPHIIAGKLSAAGGHTLFKYLGGESVEPVVSINEGHPPLPGGIATNGSKIVWGSFVTYPENACVVWGYGTKDNKLPPALQCVARASVTATSSTGMISSVKFPIQGSHSKPQMVIAWGESAGAAYGIDKISTTYQTSYFRSKTFNIGKSFTIKNVRLPLGTAMSASMVIIPTIYVDDETSSTALRTVNNTNFPNSERVINLYDPVNGKNNFLLELKWTGTALLPVLMPIEILVEINNE